MEPLEQGFGGGGAGRRRGAVGPAPRPLVVGVEQRHDGARRRRESLPW